MNRDDLRILIEKSTDVDEKVILHGKLINSIKVDLKKAKDVKEKLELADMLSKELDIHKKLIKDAKKAKESGKRFSIPRRVGLVVKDIANTIDIFKHNNDIATKKDNVIKTTAVSSIVVGAITTALAAATGTLSLATIASFAPTVCYIGLSSIIREMFNKTSFQNLLEQYKSKDSNYKKEVEFTQQYLNSNTEYIELCKKLVSTQDEMEKITILDRLIELTKQIKVNAPTDGVRKTLDLFVVQYYSQEKEIIENLKNGYIKGKNDLTLKDYLRLEKHLIKASADNFVVQNQIKEATKEAGKNIGVSTVAIAVARSILGIAFPSMKIDELKDIMIPFFMVVISNITNMGNIIDRMKIVPMKYKEQKVKVSDPDKLREIMKNKSLAMA